MLKKKLKAIFTLSQLVFFVAMGQQLQASRYDSEEFIRKRNFRENAVSGNLYYVQAQLHGEHIPDQTAINMGLCGAARRGSLNIVDEIINSELANQQGVNLALFKAVKADQIMVTRRLIPHITGCCCKRTENDMITADTSGIYIAYCEALADDNKRIIQTLEPLLWSHLILWARLQQAIKPLNNWLSDAYLVIRDDVKFLATFNAL